MAVVDVLHSHGPTTLPHVPIERLACFAQAVRADDVLELAGALVALLHDLCKRMPCAIGCDQLVVTNALRKGLHRFADTLVHHVGIHTLLAAELLNVRAACPDAARKFQIRTGVGKFSPSL